MKYSKQDFDKALAQLTKGMRPELYSTAFWLLEDYNSVGMFLKSGIISSEYAEAEYDRLTEELLEEVKKKSSVKQAGVMLIINQGMILAVERKTKDGKYGLPGGKFNSEPPDNDKDTKDTAIRETLEETYVTVKECQLIYERVELGDGPTGVDFYSRCYYATSWSGIPCNRESLDVKWLTAEEVTSTRAAFGDYNRKTLDVFKTMFPNVYIKGE